MEGFAIAKTVQALSEDRQKINTELADQGDTIRELLEQRDKIIEGLKYYDRLEDLGFDEESKFLR